MEKLQRFIETRSPAEKALLMVAAAVAIFLAGYNTGEAIAYITGAA